MAIDIKDWVEGTNQHHNDPNDFNGTNPSCKLCDKEIEQNDEYCSEHQRCVMCGDNKDCDCKDEWSGTSSCCEAVMDTDTKMCKRCNDHCDSVWETEMELARG
tara:strand:+ start:7318 stop:7626 length:309 start_codon:yes stop_codon:yes gene_type:complete